MKLTKRSLLTFLLTFLLIFSYPKITINSAQSENIIPIFAQPSKQEKFNNKWSKESEQEFQQRAKYIINYFSHPEVYGNSFGENEKRSYARAMFDFLAGNREKAVEFLQLEDDQQEEHQHTAGIDYYFSFTLKGQIRKYFLFGEYLEPKYKQRMYEGAKNWTKNDPLTQPHPLHGFGDGVSVGWSTKAKGAWVDGRNTDNLRAMRETSVYLMAEETGNEVTRQLYKQKIKRYVWALYHIGMGEWDSEVYHGHTFAPYLNLYDFAKDEEVKQLAKLALDWLSTSAAIKYYRGGWGGPVKRDYGGSNVVFASGAARTFWLYFGDSPVINPEPELDTLYMITSSYRPPQEVVALAQKKFPKPVEILATKPSYENWKEGKSDLPAYWETTYITDNYQMGSLVSTFPDGDVAPFKLMSKNSQRGVDYFVANTGINSLKAGKNPNDQIGQYENILIWLHYQPKTPSSPPLKDGNLGEYKTNQPSFFWQLPTNIVKQIEDNIWFFQLENSWLAMFPLNLTNYQIMNLEENAIYQKNKDSAKYKYYNDQIYHANSQGEPYFGFALIVGDRDEYDNYNQFKQAIKSKSLLNTTNLNQGKVTLISPEGKSLKFAYNPDNLLPIIERNGKSHNWLENLALYNSQNAENIPIYLGWKQGKLTVKIDESNQFISSFPSIK